MGARAAPPPRLGPSAPSLGGLPPKHRWSRRLGQGLRRLRPPDMLRVVKMECCRLDARYITEQGDGMTLSNAERQQRWREKREAEAQSRPDVVEQALLAEVERANQLSDDERAALADKITDLAMQYQWRAAKLAKIAEKLRPPDWVPPGFPGR